MSAAWLRRGQILRIALAAALGVGLALLVGCGSTGKGLIPSVQGNPLLEDFQEVKEDAESGEGNCAPTDRALAKTESDYRALPASVNAGLRATLREGIKNLALKARELCSEPLSHTTTTSTTAKPPTKTPTAPKTTSTPTTTEPPVKEPTEQESEKTPGAGGTGGEETEHETGGVAPPEEPHQEATG